MGGSQWVLSLSSAEASWAERKRGSHGEQRPREEGSRRILPTASAAFGEL